MGKLNEGIFDIPPDLEIYGWSLADIRKVQNWMRCQNITLKDLDCGSFSHHYWEKQKVMNMLREDFR